MDMFKDLEHSAVEPNAQTYELMAEIQIEENDLESAKSIINTMVIYISHIVLIGKFYLVTN